MKYLVMEVHPAYAVVLDESGRFLKTANFGYTVGETVTDILTLQMPEQRRNPIRWLRPVLGVTAAAACAAVGFFGYYQPNYLPYGTLLVQINPEVLLTVSRTERVLETEGRNEDGRHLLEGYDCRGKDREQVLDELVERAIALGYLSGGGTVSVTVDSEDAAWQQTAEEQTYAQLNDHYGESIVISVGTSEEQENVQEDHESVVIPVKPSQPETATPAPQPPQQTVPQGPTDDRDDGPETEKDDDHDADDQDDDQNDDVPSQMMTDDPETDDRENDDDVEPDDGTVTGGDDTDDDADDSDDTAESDDDDLEDDGVDDDSADDDDTDDDG